MPDVKVPGKKLTDREAVMAGYLMDRPVKDLDVDCLGLVYVKTCELDFFGPDDVTPHMPYLRFYGEIRGLKGDFPYGVDQISYDPGTGQSVHCTYRLADDQAARLVAKGLYHQGFRVPPIMMDNEMEFPVSIKVRAVAPDHVLDENGEPVKDQVAIMFTQVKDPHAIETDREGCGYDFVEYFGSMTDLPDIRYTKDMEAENELQADDQATPSVIEQQAPEMPDVQEEEDPVSLDQDFMDIMRRIYSRNPDIARLIDPVIDHEETDLPDLPEKETVQIEKTVIESPVETGPEKTEPEETALEETEPEMDGDSFLDQGKGETSLLGDVGSEDIETTPEVLPF